jgi:hypothetical protein
MYKYTEEELLEKFAEVYEHFKSNPIKEYTYTNNV